MAARGRKFRSERRDGGGRKKVENENEAEGEDEQRRTQRRLREDSGILALFCEPGSPESSPRIFLSGLYVPHSQWG